MTSPFARLASLPLADRREVLFRLRRAQQRGLRGESLVAAAHWLLAHAAMKGMETR